MLLTQLKTIYKSLKLANMKTLKITFLLLAVVLLTVSGQSSDSVVDTDETTYKQGSSNYDLLAVNKKKKALQQQG